MSIGPDQRIHVSCGNGTNILHTIHKPNEAGIACDFRQHDYEMPATSLFYLPNMPNYRLYQMPGSPCDTLGIQPPIVAFWRSDPDSFPGLLTREFTDISWYKPVSWHWDFGDGTTSEEKEVIHTFPAPAVYTVCLIVCNAEGHCDTLCKDINLQVSGTTAASGQELSQASVYPNPATNEVWVTHATGVDQYFTLYDQLGRIVLHKSLPDQREMERIVLSNIEPGMYFWTVDSGQTQAGVGRLVVLPEKP